ncbi:hypothetical protein [Vibrio diabolicus]|uniref:hypothetical protein n=1 Tax=Vibrio diabolicus TaxID=50719 RepID=UPI00211A1C1F|nr:hypothetical protein [Vibrio diabolicus]MCQ9049379.1 hypothetical protein [Vibrio diabolicus]
MFGFFKRKALKNIATNIYQELVRGRIHEGTHYGLSADDISEKTGLNLFSSRSLIHRLVASGLVEEYDFLDVVCYRAVNVPIYLDETSSPNSILQYVKRAIARVDFKGLT